MLKLRQLEVTKERNIEIGDEVVGKNFLTQEVYCTEGKYPSVPVVADYDIFAENVSLLSQLVRRLRRRQLPVTIDYNGFTYKIDEKTKSSLREISELSSDDEVHAYSTVSGVTEISAQDSINIRSLMLDGTQAIFNKFKTVSDMISELKDMDDVEEFKLTEEWIKS